MTNMNTLTFEILSDAVKGHAAAFRSITTLQPVGGVGDKIFPATFAEGKYAEETRRVNPSDPMSEQMKCILLDSVASQANRAEEALLAAVRSGELVLPLIEVDFSEANKSLRVRLPNLTSLEVPHRLADAILRDSQLEDGTRFSKSKAAASWAKSTTWDATGIYELCPTGLLFGMWGSPDKPGGLGAKFERAYVSEIVGVGTTDIPDRMGYRIDPLGASSYALLTPPKADGTFELAADKVKGALKPSGLNHGNVPHDSKNGGARFAFVEQTTVVSLGALRKLRFPVGGKSSPDLDVAGRTVLAALGLCAGALAGERGTSLRSRCHLWPTEPRAWQLLATPGIEPVSYSITGAQAIELLKEAVTGAEAAGLAWHAAPIKLKPTKELVALIAKSQEVQAKETTEEGK